MQGLPCLKKVLREKGIAQSKLADELGVHEVTVSRWVTGESKPDYPTLKRIAGMLGCTVDEIIADPPSAIDEEAA